MAKPSDTPESVTQLLEAWNEGDRKALDRLVPIVQDQLRKIATRYMGGERRNHTLQPSALVNEAYLRLVDQKETHWKNRAHFLGIAAKTMRDILVDHARRKRAEKRGGDLVRVTLDDALRGPTDHPLDVIAVHEALEKLSELDERQGRVVELRFFAGLTVEETSEALGIAKATVKREWQTAKAFMYAEIGD